MDQELLNKFLSEININVAKSQAALPEETHTDLWQYGSPWGTQCEMLKDQSNTRWNWRRAKELACACYRKQLGATCDKDICIEECSGDRELGERAEVKPVYLDIGCGSGFGAWELLCHAYMNGVALDYVDLGREVETRNKALDGQNLKFVCADILQTDAKTLVAKCYNQNPVFVTLSGVALQLQLKELEKVIGLVAETIAPGGVFSILYDTHFEPSWPGVHEHSADRVAKIAKQFGFEEEFRDVHDVEFPIVKMHKVSQAFRLAAPPQGNRMYGKPLLQVRQLYATLEPQQI